MNEPQRWRWSSDADEAPFVRRVLIVLALVGLAYLIYRLTNVLLLTFGAVLVAVILSSLAQVISARTPVPERWSLAVAGLLLLILFAIIGVLFGHQIGAQLGQLGETLPNALRAVLARFGIENVQESFPDLVGANFGRDVVGRLATFSATLLGGLADFLVVLVAGIFLAIDPHLYRRGFLKLFPKDQHARIDDALATSGTALALWLKGQVIAMALVGTMAGIGFWLVGLPSALALGMIAGILEFIPFVGSFLGVLPALVIAATLGGSTFLWTLVVFAIVQQVESNLVTPLIQRRTVELPPALSLLAVLAFGVLLGPLGLVLAVPLTVVVYVWVKKLYVRQTLGEATPVPGEREGSH